MASPFLESTKGNQPEVINETEAAMDGRILVYPAGVAARDGSACAAVIVDASKRFSGIAIISRMPWDKKREDWEALEICGRERGKLSPDQLLRAALREALSSELIKACARDGIRIFLLAENPSEMTPLCEGITIEGKPVEIIGPETQDHKWLLRRALREARSVRADASRMDREWERGFRASFDFENCGVDNEITEEHGYNGSGSSRW